MYQCVLAGLQYGCSTPSRISDDTTLLTATLVPDEELGGVLVSTRDDQLDKPSPGTLDSGAAARQKAFFSLSR